MPANLLSSSSLLSGTVVVMLLLWLFGSALMTLRVGTKNQPAVTSPTRTPGEPDQANPAETLDRDDEEPLVEPVSQPQVVSELRAAGAASSLDLTRGQRAARYAGPEMVSFAASVDS